MGIPALRWVIGSAVLVVAIVIAATSVVLSRSAVTDTDAASSSTVDQPLPSTFATAPTTRWTLQAAELAAGRDPALFSPVWGGRMYERPGAITADGVAVVMANGASNLRGSGNSDEQPSMVGIDLATGSVKWTTPSSLDGGCSPTPLDGTLPCITTNNGQSSTIEFIDLTDGSTRSTHSTDFGVLAVTVADGYVYLGGFTSGDDGKLVLSKGTVDNPESEWTRQYAPPDCGYGGGDYYNLDVRGNTIVWNSGDSVVASADDGAPILEGVSSAAFVTDSKLSAAICSGYTASGSPDVRNSVFLPNGSVFIDRMERAASYDFTMGSNEPPVIDSDRTAFDQDGKPAWRAPLTGTLSGPLYSIDQTIYSVDGGSVYAFDSGTGKLTWSVPTSDSGATPSVNTDGSSLIVSNSTTTTAYSLADGSATWSVATPSGSESKLVPVDGGLLSAGAGGMTLLVPSGGAPSVPN